MIRVLLFVCLLCVLTLAIVSETVSAQGLSEAAIPSLILLGTAKGGTTDLWHMIHRIHKGFCSYDPHTTKDFDQHFPEHIQTKKELDFFSRGFDSVCSGKDDRDGGGGGGGGSGDVCSASDMSVLLRCPNALINKWVEERKMSADKVNNIAARCREWLEVNQIDKSRYSITASPSLMYEHQAAARAIEAFNALQSQSQPGSQQRCPLYVMLLRHPVERIVSLYNHWFRQEQHTGNGYALPLEALVELELTLLQRETPQKHIAVIKEAMKSKKNIRKIQKALRGLRSFMEVELETVSRGAVGRVNLRSFGLVLDGFYALQLLGWLSVPRKQRHRQANEQQPQDIRNKLLVVQSEYMFAHREEFVYDILLPFLHPNSSSSSGRDGRGKNNRGDVIVERGSNTAKAQHVQNQKKTKHESAQLSSEMARRLLAFYETIPLEVILLGLQRGARARVVPALEEGGEGGEGGHEQWWAGVDGRR